MPEDLLKLTEAGIYCPVGDFYIDPWKPVDRAIVTHGHADHARRGMGRYLCSLSCAPILRARLGDDINVDPLEFGAALIVNGAKVSLHPAGHILGSAQVRVEADGQVWVVSGDYKTVPDATCEDFELIRCNTFVTESTFGLPIFRWPEEGSVETLLNQWWASNQQAGRASILYGYALGKCQRVLAGLDPTIGPIFAHGAVRTINDAYEEGGVRLPKAMHPGEVSKGFDWSRAIILAPPSANGTPWMRRFGIAATAFASGWMFIRGFRRRRAVDRGFVLSDHVDWPSLIATISATGAERVWVTHGYTNVVARYLSEQGLRAEAISTRFEGELDIGGEEAKAEEFQAA